MTAAAQENARRQIDRRRVAAAQTLSGWAEAIRPHPARIGPLAGRGPAALLIAGALAMGVAIGYALRGRLMARSGKGAGTEASPQSAHPSGASQVGSPSPGDRLDGEAAAAVAALEAMEPDYRERARSGSDL